MHKIINIFCLLFFSLLLNAKTFLVFGGSNGWIGKKMIAVIKEAGHTALCAQSRLENRQDIIAEINATKPDYIINAASLIGKPTIAWCDDHKPETIRANLVGTLNLIDIAYMHNIHITCLSPGCLYHYNDKHPIGSGIGFTEKDEPNFTDLFYARIKIALQKIALEYPNLLFLRIQLPVSADLDTGFIARIIKQKRVPNIPNSLCILDDLLPIALDMTLKEKTGIYNFVNPGTIAHNEILDLYKKIVDPEFTYENISLKEQNELLHGSHSNAELSVEKLLQEYPEISHVKHSIGKVLKNSSK